MARLVRLRHRLDRWYTAVLLALLVLALIGAWGTYDVYASPDTTVEERVVSSWTDAGEFEHGATVVNSTDAFSKGEEVTGRPVYFTTAMPVLNGTFVYGYTASDGNLDVETDLELVIRSVDRDRNDEVTMVYWSITEPIDTRAGSLEPGETRTVPFSIDVEETHQRIEATEEGLGASPGTVEVLVRADTSIDGTVNGEAVENTSEYRLRIVPRGETYRVEHVVDREETHEIVDRRTVTVEPSPLETVAPVLLLVGAVLGAASLVVARHKDLLVSDEERTRIRHARDRDEYDDWITRGAISPELCDRPEIEVDSLEGIVDVAIDSNRRVIEETNSGAYYVVDDQLVYVYDPSIGADVLSSGTGATDGPGDQGGDGDGNGPGDEDGEASSNEDGDGIGDRGNDSEKTEGGDETGDDDVRSVA